MRSQVFDILELHPRLQQDSVVYKKAANSIAALSPFTRIRFIAGRLELDDALGNAAPPFRAYLGLAAFLLQKTSFHYFVRVQFDEAAELGEDREPLRIGLGIDT